MNIIVLVSDTFRHENLKGGAEPEVPELSKFAQNSVTFKNCYTGSFPTIPHRTDCFTGKYTFPWHGWQQLDTDIPVLSTILADNGYGNQIIADTPHLMKEDYYFDRGFHGAKWLKGQEGTWELTRFNSPLENIIPDDKTKPEPRKLGLNPSSAHLWHNSDWVWEEDRFCAQTARSASKWLELNYKRDDFLLWVDMFDVHEPWDPPEYLVEKYHQNGPDAPMLAPNYGHASEYSPDELENLRAHYFGEVSLVDKWIGYLLDKIENLGLMQDTMIIFTSDHGIFLGEHDRTGKTNVSSSDDRYWPLYEQLVHVPLIIHHPESLSGKKVESLVQPVDIFATIMDQVGVEGIDTHGHSLLPELTTREQRKLRDYAFSSTTINKPYSKGSSSDKLQWPTVTGGGWSYVTLGSKGEPELYNLEEDPEQQSDVFKENPEKARQMHEALIDWLERIKAPERSVENMKLLKP